VKNLATALLVLALAAGCAGGPSEEEEPELLIFAAASLRDALEATAEEFEAQSGTQSGTQSGAKLRFNFAGSNLLALQIEAAPRADVFLSANERWMDYVDERELLASGSRRTLLSNGLVVVANEHADLSLEKVEDLSRLPFRFLSLADPEAVPAGRYAREYLEGVAASEKASVWQAVESRGAPAPDVRAALALVEAEPEILGIVYRTDAAASTGVRVLYEVPIEEGPPIRYSAAAVAVSSQQELARRYLEFLGSDVARKIFESQGFLVIEEDEKGGEAGG